jgi:lipoate-protein ligase A
MILIDRTETDPYFNIAAEEYVLKEFAEDVFMLWVNSPSVIIGKHQVAAAEADIFYTYKKNIPLIRRISGGGTVYHDEGNLNYSLLVSGEKGKLVDYKKYSGSVIRALATQELIASLQGKTNLAINGLKFSGSAEHVFRKRVLHHGTILFNSDLEKLRKCIRPAHNNYSDKAIRSTDSSIANITDHLPGKMKLDTFRKILINQIKIDFPGITGYSFSMEDKQKIRKLVYDKYSSPDWNFGYSPKYSLSKEITFRKEKYRIDLRTENGLIREVLFSTKGSEVFTGISHHLKNVLHHPKTIKDVFLSINFAMETDHANLDELIAALF